MNDSIRRWNEENHVSEKISAALESVAQVTQHVFDSIFPSMSVVGETNGPVSDEVYFANCFSCECILGSSSG